MQGGNIERFVLLLLIREVFTYISLGYEREKKTSNYPLIQPKE